MSKIPPPVDRARPIVSGNPLLDTNYASCKFAYRSMSFFGP
jgi:hypothetical protein